MWLFPHMTKVTCLHSHNFMNRIIQMKRGLELDLPVLNEGEFGFTIDTKKLFIGSDTGNVQIAQEVDLEALKTIVNSHLEKNSSTSDKGHVQLSTAVDSDDTTMAATSSAVKAVRDDFNTHLADMATQLALKVNKSDIQDMRIKTFRVNASGNVTVTFSKSGFFLILINRNNTETRGIYFADTYITTVDRWTINTVSAASDIIITTGANTLNFANSSATYYADIMIVSFSGSIMT